MINHLKTNKLWLIWIDSKRRGALTFQVFRITTSLKSTEEMSRWRTVETLAHPPTPAAFANLLLAEPSPETQSAPLTSRCAFLRWSRGECFSFCHRPPAWLQGDGSMTLQTGTERHHSDKARLSDNIRRVRRLMSLMVTDQNRSSSWSQWMNKNTNRLCFCFILWGLKYDLRTLNCFSFK